MMHDYRHAAYQPGYPGQPVHFTSMPPAYSLHGQFVAAGQPPNYSELSRNAQLSNQPAFNVQCDQSSVEQLRETDVTITLPLPAVSQPEQHQQQYENLGFAK